jgi:hypothetical protein
MKSFKLKAECEFENMGGNTSSVGNAACHSSSGRVFSLEMSAVRGIIFLCFRAQHL